MKCPPEMVLIPLALSGSCCPETNSHVPSSWLFFVSLPLACDQARSTAATVIARTSDISFMMSSFFVLEIRKQRPRGMLFHQTPSSSCSHPEPRYWLKRPAVPKLSCLGLIGITKT